MPLSLFVYTKTEFHLSNLNNKKCNNYEVNIEDVNELLLLFYN